MLHLFCEQHVLINDWDRSKRTAPEELGEEVRVKVQDHLNLTKADFAVLLGIAEKLKPNFYVTLVGDPNIIQEVCLFFCFIWSTPERLLHCQRDPPTPHPLNTPKRHFFLFFFWIGTCHLPETFMVNGFRLKAASSKG